MYRLARAILTYVPSSLVWQAASVIHRLLLAALLAPAHYGVYGLVMLFVRYSSYCHLGLWNGFSREFPILLGARQTEHAEKVWNTAVVGSTALSLVAALACYLYVGHWALARGEYSGRTLATAVACLVVIQVVGAFVQARLRGAQSFGVLSQMNYAFPLPLLLLTIGLARSHGAVGAVVAVAIASPSVGIAPVVYAVVRGGIRCRLEVDLRLLRGLLIAGMPIALAAALDVALLSVDRLLVSAWRSLYDLGVYTFASNLAQIPWMIISSVGFVIFPMMLQSYGEDRSLEALRAYVYYPTMTALCIVGWLYGVMLITVSVGVPVAYEQYSFSVRTSLILLAAMSLWSYANVYTYALVAVERLGALVILQIVALVLCSGVLALTRTRGLEWVAAGVLVSLGAYSLAIQVFVGVVLFGFRVRRAFREPVLELLGIALAAGLAWLCAAAAGKVTAGVGWLATVALSASAQWLTACVAFSALWLGLALLYLGQTGRLRALSTQILRFGGRLNDDGLVARAGERAVIR